METKTNVANMSKCPRFISCNCNLCPLDEFMKQRVDLPEDELCQLRRITEGLKRTRTTRERFTGKLGGMKKLLEFVPKANKPSCK